MAVLSWTLARTATIGRRGRRLRAMMAQLSLAVTTSNSMPPQWTRRMARTSAGTVSPSAAFSVPAVGADLWLYII